MSHPPDDIGICLGTLLGGAGARSDADMARAIRAASDAGFTSVSLFTQWSRSSGPASLAALLDDLGLEVKVVEAAMSWDESPAAAVAEAEAHLEVASVLGARTLQAVLLAPTVASRPRVVEGFAALCERAREHDVSVALEFVPWSAIPDLDTAWRIVSESGAGNGGICLDMLHWHRQPDGPDHDVLRRIPGERIHYVQVCDAPPTDVASRREYMAQALGARPLPGDGVVDIDELLDALAEIGADPFFAYEVFNTELAAEGPEAMAGHLRAAAPGRRR